MARFLRFFFWSKSGLKSGLVYWLIWLLQALLDFHIYLQTYAIVFYGLEMKKVNSPSPIDDEARSKIFETINRQIIKPILCELETLINDTCQRERLARVDPKSIMHFKIWRTSSDMTKMCTQDRSVIQRFSSSLKQWMHILQDLLKGKGKRRNLRGPKRHNKNNRRSKHRQLMNNKQLININKKQSNKHSLLNNKQNKQTNKQTNKQNNKPRWNRVRQTDKHSTIKLKCTYWVIYFQWTKEANNTNRKLFLNSSVLQHDLPFTVIIKIKLYLKLKTILIIII